MRPSMRRDWLSETAIYSLLVLALFIVARLIYFWHAPDFWIDEAMLGVALRSHDASRLLQPMAYYEQAAPLAYLIAGKAAGTFAGFTDQAMRAISVIAGAVAAVLVFLSTRRLANETAAFLAAALFVFSPVSL